MGNTHSVLYLFGVVLRKEADESWLGYKKFAALAGLRGLKTNEETLHGAANAKSDGANESPPRAVETLDTSREFTTDFFSATLGSLTFLPVLASKHTMK